MNNLTAFAEGYQARKEKLTQWANPYDENQPGLRNAWIAGWMTKDKKFNGALSFILAFLFFKLWEAIHHCTISSI